MVTVELLKAKGYPISILKNQESITLAEDNIKMAYFPSDTIFDELEDTICALTFALILRRISMATRFGSVQKVDGFSQQVEEQKSMREARGYALPYYNSWLKNNPNYKFTDIIPLYDNFLI